MRNALWLDIQDQLVAERAASREAGATLLRSDMNGDIALGQHDQHAASSTTTPSSLAYDDMEEGEAQQGGGDLVAALDVEVWVFTPEGIPVCDVEATLALREQLDAPRLTWLERMARRWPARVS